MYYVFTNDELPFKKNTTLRFLCKAAVMRRQFGEGEHVSFSPETIVRLTIPGEGFEPFITATCPVTGSCLRLIVQVQPERKLETRDDAIAYLRRALCIEAIAVSERDKENVVKHGSRRHYTKEFFEGLIAKYRWRIENFHTYTYSPIYD